MEFLYLFIGWLVGLFVCSFTVIPILIIFVFGLPATKKLERLDLINDDNHIARGYLISIAVLSGVLIGSYYTTHTIFPNLAIGFNIGGIMTLVFGLGKVGKNTNNISDFIQANQRHFKVAADEVASTLAS